MSSIVLRAPSAPSWPRFAVWLTRLVFLHGDRILRVKGILFDSDRATWIGIHGVRRFFHPPVHLTLGEPAGLRGLPRLHHRGARSFADRAIISKSARSKRLSRCARRRPSGLKQQFSGANNPASRASRWSPGPCDERRQTRQTEGARVMNAIRWKAGAAIDCGCVAVDGAGRLRAERALARQRLVSGESFDGHRHGESSSRRSRGCRRIQSRSICFPAIRSAARSSRSTSYGPARSKWPGAD